MASHTQDAQAGRGAKEARHVDVPALEAFHAHDGLNVVYVDGFALVEGATEGTAECHPLRSYLGDDAGVVEGFLGLWAEAPDVA